MARQKNVRILRARRAQVLLQHVARRFGFTVEQMRKDVRDSRLVAARREYCARVDAEGIGSVISGKILGRNQGTIRYHLSPAMQQARQERYHLKKEKARERTETPDTAAADGIEPATARAGQLPRHGDAVRGGEARGL